MAKPRFTLVCKTEPLNKPTFLSTILLSAEDRQAMEETQLLVPERLLFECYGKLLGDSVEFVVRELKGCKLAADEVFSEYPVLLFGDKLIQKTNIAAFLRRVTTIDDKFNDSALNSPGINERLQIERDSILRLSTMV